MKNIENMSIECPGCGAKVDTSMIDSGESRTLRCPYCDSKMKVSIKDPQATKKNLDLNMDDPAKFYQTIILQTGSKMIADVQLVKNRVFPLIIIIGVFILLLGLGIPFFMFRHTGYSMVKNTGLKTIFTGVKNYHCRGTERLIFNNDTLDGQVNIVASENCQIVMNNSTMKSKKNGITLEDHAKLTINNSNIQVMDIGIIAKNYSKITSINSTIIGKTAIYAKDFARVNLVNSTIKGLNFAYRKKGNAKVSLVNTHTDGAIE